MTTMLIKPKERQFQVVPVPAIFTRGRWECVDYKDGAQPGTMGGGGNETTPAAPQTAHYISNSGILANSSVPHFEISPNRSVPTTLGTDFVPPNASSAESSTASTGACANSSTGGGGSSCTGPNAVAIDNKIEQAMDLVKTHLTFAVREEVEIMQIGRASCRERVSR